MTGDRSLIIKHSIMNNPGFYSPGLYHSQARAAREICSRSDFIGPSLQTGISEADQEFKQVRRCRGTILIQVCGTWTL